MTAWGNARVTARRTARGNACVRFSRTGGKQLSTRIRDGCAGSEPSSSFARWSELQRAEAAEGKVRPGGGRPSPSDRLRVPMGSRMRHRGERSPADSTFTPSHAGSRVRFAGVVPGAPGGGIEEPPPGSWPQRIGRPDRWVIPEHAPAPRRTPSSPSRGRPSHRRRTQLRATDNAAGLRVVVPEEPPRLSPRAARILLEILIKAGGRNPRGHQPLSSERDYPQVARMGRSGSTSLSALNR